MSSQGNFALESFKDSSILLTGSTGFLGKVVLAMMLDRLPHIQSIYLLIRKGKKSALERFIQEIQSSPIFESLYKDKQNVLKQRLEHHVTVIEGDVALPNFGLQETLIAELSQSIDLVIHSAGIVDFFPSVRTAFDVNVKGAINAADFVRGSSKARLLHISTCYVAGNKSGTFDEEVVVGQSPNGNLFDADKEFISLKEAIEQIEIKNSTSKRNNTRQLILLGMQRAKQWGWSNTYCYTKALAELLLTSQYKDISLTIIRPSIIESAVTFPFPGWNEGENGTAPLSFQMGESWYAYFIAKKQNVLDLIPVDLVSQAILLVGAAQLRGIASGVYQVASSMHNPCLVSDFIQALNYWYSRRYAREKVNWADRYVRFLFPIRCVSVDNFLVSSKCIKKLTQLTSYINRMKQNQLTTKTKKLINHCIRQVRYIKILSAATCPFIHDHRFRFVANKLSQISFQENQVLQKDICAINWEQYLREVHLPGLNQWVFPKLCKENRMPSDVSYE